MKKHFRYGLFFALGAMLALGFVACGDESSSGPSKNEETGIETEVSSSSVDEVLSSSVHIEESSSSFESEGLSSSVERGASSSSEKSTESSSGKNTEPAEVSSCSVAEGSSSSTIVEQSSSSVKAEQSSSSEKAEASSSSVKIQESSSSAKVEESSSSAKTDASSSSEKPAESSSSEEIVESSSSEASSSSVIQPCKTATEDNCIYGTLLDKRDGHTYKTVKIGNQEWMAENLNFEYNEGSAKSFCYKNDTTNCTTYGRLYNWSAAIDSISYYNEYNKQCGWKQSKCSIPTLWKGICPNGSHIPSLDEWKDLLSNLDSTIAGKVLKSLEYWSDGKNGTDLYGFSVLPSGEWGGSNYMNKGKESVFWIASDFSKESAYNIIFSYDSDKVLIMNDWKTFDYSVRCIKD